MSRGASIRTGRRSGRARVNVTIVKGASEDKVEQKTGSDGSINIKAFIKSDGARGVREGRARRDDGGSVRHQAEGTRLDDGGLAGSGVQAAARNVQDCVAPFRTPLKTDMDDGQTRQRRSSTKRLTTISFSIRMTRAELLVFEAWVRDTLVDGTLEFTMNVWAGTGYSNKTCTFNTPYAASDGPYPFAYVDVTLDVEDY
jgi:hypothetical protein